MDLKKVFLQFDLDIKLNYKNRKEFCIKFGLNYADVTNLFGRIYRLESSPRVDMVEKIAVALGYEMTFNKIKN